MKIKFYLMMYSLMVEIVDHKLFQGIKNVYCICDKNIAWILNYLLKPQGIKVWHCSEKFIKTKTIKGIHRLQEGIFILEETQNGKLSELLETNEVKPENIFVIPLRLDELRGTVS